MVELRVFATPVTVAKRFFVELVAVWGGVTWWVLRARPGRGIWRGSLVALVTTIVLMGVEWGHALAHIFSARYAGAPMDEIRLSGGMPRTLYWNNDVSPDVHRIRAMGGPLFNLLGLLVSVVTHWAASRNSVVGEVAGYSVVGHALLFIMSLLPLPMVDGGTLMKWTLVARGQAEAQADETVRCIDWAMAFAGCISGVSLIATRRRAAGGTLMGCGVLVAAIAAGKIR
jgi:hypothetical protein